MAMGLAVYVIVATYSIIFSMRRLGRPGVASRVRMLFFKKHSAYVVLFIVIWTIQLFSSYYHLFNPEAVFSDPDEEMGTVDSGDFKIITTISGASMFSTGILLATVRLFEPYFLFLLKKFWY